MSQLKEAKLVDEQIKAAYRRGIRDGIIAGLKKAVLLSNSIEPYTSVLKRCVDQEIANEENKEI